MTIEEKAQKYDEIVKFVFDETNNAAFHGIFQSKPLLTIRTMLQLKSSKEIKQKQ